MRWAEHVALTGEKRKTREEESTGKRNTLAD
jgi:hypothetical protein